MITDGVYSGEFAIEYYKYRRSNPEEKQKGLPGIQKTHPTTLALILFGATTRRYGTLLIAISFFFTIFTGFFAIKTRNLFLVLLLYVIGYQSAINVFAYHVPLYTTNVIFFHMLNVSFGLLLLHKYMKSRRMFSEEMNNDTK